MRQCPTRSAKRSTDTSEAAEWRNTSSKSSNGMLISRAECNAANAARSTVTTASDWSALVTIARSCSGNGPILALEDVPLSKNVLDDRVHVHAPGSQQILVKLSEM